ncbi:MAG: hypothetical protein ACE5KM_14285 [Planctomycetaceae bacterium]
MSVTRIKPRKRTRRCDHCREKHCICDARVCNCARCGKLLTSDQASFELLFEAGLSDIDVPAGREDDRPYCWRGIPITRDHVSVAIRFHNHRTPRQRAKMGSGSC